MILLEKGNRILLETASSMIVREDEEEGKEAKSFTPCEVKLNDFDDVSYNVKVDAADPSTMTVSMYLPIFSEIAKMGGDDAAKEAFGDLLATSKDENEVTLAVKFDAIPEDDQKKEDLCKKISQMKNHVVGGVFDYYFKALRDKAPREDKKELRIRGDTTLYFVPGSDRVTVIYALDFADTTDQTIAKVFMEIFAGTRHSGAPPCNFKTEPPNELKDNFGVTENTGVVGYLSFAVLERHVKDTQRDMVIHVLQTFRSFLQYHIKMSKSYWHSKMRARCVSLQKVLNRAKIEDPDDQKKKTTASGKTFKR